MRLCGSSSSIRLSATSLCDVRKLRQFLSLHRFFRHAVSLPDLIGSICSRLVALQSGKSGLRSSFLGRYVDTAANVLIQVSRQEAVLSLCRLVTSTCGIVSSDGCQVL